MGIEIKKNQTLDVQKAVEAWLKHSPKDAKAIIFGEGPQERHTPYRLNNILDAYMQGKEDQLPPIRFAPQFGEVEDGRHRLAMAYLFDKPTIKANLVYVTPDEEEEDW